MAKIGYGISPIDITIQNWAERYARVFVITLLHSQGKQATSLQVTRMTRELVKTDPRWIERAIGKVMGKGYRK